LIAHLRQRQAKFGEAGSGPHSTKKTPVSLRSETGGELSFLGQHQDG